LYCCQKYNVGHPLFNRWRICHPGHFITIIYENVMDILAIVGVKTKFRSIWTISSRDIIHHLNFTFESKVNAFDMVVGRLLKSSLAHIFPLGSLKVTWYRTRVCGYRLTTQTLIHAVPENLFYSEFIFTRRSGCIIHTFYRCANFVRLVFFFFSKSLNERELLVLLQCAFYFLFFYVIRKRF